MSKEWTCDRKRATFNTKSKAIRYASSLGWMNKHFHVYHCQYCKDWHLTSQDRPYVKRVGSGMEAIPRKKYPERDHFANGGGMAGKMSRTGLSRSYVK